MKTIVFAFALISFLIITFVKTRRDYRRLLDEKVSKKLDADTSDSPDVDESETDSARA